MVVSFVKYIGPFLRMHKLNKSNIENQLLYLSRETINHIVLYSKCGICCPIKELKDKNIPAADINIFDNLHPLLSIYKKANAHLADISNTLSWDEDSFKREIDIGANALMTLCIIELISYYKTFNEKYPQKHTLNFIYGKLAKKQLEFYSSYLRNEEGVFVDKKDISDLDMNELKFEEKNKKFKFSNQALLMAAFYNYSLANSDKDSPMFRDFSYDILKMLLDYKEELYTLSFDELNKLCLSFNIFYRSSSNAEVLPLLIDLWEYLEDNYSNNAFLNSDNKLEYECMLYINSVLLYKNTNMLKFNDFAELIYNKLIELYTPELGIIIKTCDKKEISFSNLEVILYLLAVLLHSKNSNVDSDDNMIALDIFKRQVIESGLILSWPDPPDPNDPERYKNFSLKEEDFLEDQNFRQPNAASLLKSESASIFIKNIVYNKKKQEFSQSKLSFDSYNNMLIFFLILYLQFDM